MEFKYFVSLFFLVILSVLLIHLVWKDDIQQTTSITTSKIKVEKKDWIIAILSIAFVSTLLIIQLMK